MNNGRSQLIPQIEANLLATVVFLGCAAVSILNGFVGWLSLVTFVLTLLVFFLDSNTFVRKNSMLVIVLYLTVLVSSLVFGALLGAIPIIGVVFRIIDWVLRCFVALIAVIGALQAAGGNVFNPSLFGAISTAICSKLGVY